MPRSVTDVKQSSTHKTDAAADIQLGDWLRQSQNPALKLLGIPVRGVELLGKTVIDWFTPGPESETAWMHTTHFPSDKIRQELIDGYWEERESKQAAQSKRGG